MKKTYLIDALTTASIILCANDNLTTDKVQFSNIQSLQDLSKIDEIINKYPNLSETEQTYHFTELNPEIKWKASIKSK